MAILNDDVIEPFAIGRGRQAGRRRVSIGLGFMGGEPGVNKVPVFSPRRGVVFELRSGRLRHALAREAQQSRGFRDFKKVRPAPGGSAMPLDESKRCTA
jgi:hypothetical protein